MKLKKEEFLKKKDDIPAFQGYFTLQNGDGKVLYSAVSSNLQRTIRLFLQQAKDDEKVMQLASLTESIEFEATDTLLKALLMQKEIVNIQKPDFAFPFYQEYAYISFDLHQVPFINVQNDTQKEFLFLGPFQLRFFIYDALQVLADNFQYPLCEDKNYPCARLQQNKCSGFCLKEPLEWQTVLAKSYLQKDAQLLQKLEGKEQQFKENLQFREAESIKKQRKILEKYYTYVVFFHVVKKLDLTFACYDKQVTLTNGQISSLETNGKNYFFPFYPIEFRENEHLAIEKEQLDEAWIVFQYLYQTKKEYIEKIYTESIEKMQNLEN